MPNVHKHKIVINTGPVLALIAGLGSLDILKSMYKRVIVPYEVCEEVQAGGMSGFGVSEFNNSDFLDKLDSPTVIHPYLRSVLDSGESSVIQTTLDEEIQTVCIDETVGRRIAGLNGLRLTGSLGIMIRCKKEGYPLILRESISRMRMHGVWLSEHLIACALQQAGE